MTAIAIDFGTSNTLVCFKDPTTGEPKTLRWPHLSRSFLNGERWVDVIPTLVYVEKPEQMVFGEQVRAQRLGSRHPERFFQSFKRDLVADFVPPARSIDGHLYTVESIAESFLKGILASLSDHQIKPSQVIFTAPVGSFEGYLNWLRKIAESMALPPIQVIDESTAAALGYSISHPGSLVLVIDFGGGTLDLSLVKTASPQPGKTILKAEVIAKTDAYVGGVDIDQWIVDYYLNQLGSSRAKISPLIWQNLLEIAESIKIKLSHAQQAQESWFDDETFMAYEMSLNQSQLTEILEAQQLLEQIRQAIDDILFIAQGKGIPKPKIDHVLMVGGTCQIPAIQQLVISYFGRKRVQWERPFEAVAYGALLLADQIEIEDYLGHSYAIRLWDPTINGYSYYSLFEKGSPYPCHSPEPLILQVASNGQSEIRLDIGEVADVSQSEVIYDQQGRMRSRRLVRQTDFRPLSGQNDPVCIARLDPPGQIGVDRIRVSFQVNQERVLLATVEDLLSHQGLVEDQPVAKLT